MKPEKNTRWSGQFNGVQFEIQNFNPYNSKDFWTFYLYISIDKIPKENNPESFWLPPEKDDRGHIRYDYYKHQILGEIEWHCGMTFYSKEAGFDESPRIIKVGCDFQHYWDEGRDYDLEDVYAEAVEAAKSFRRLVLRYKYWCHWNGSLHSPSEIIVSGDGAFKCVENCSGRRAYEKKWPDKSTKTEIA